MKRREFMVLPVVALAAPGAALGQAAQRTYRIAILDETTEAGLEEVWSAFRARLRALGYVEGKNIRFDARHAAGAADRLPSLAAELVALKPDLVACAGTPAARAAIRATSSIPIVFVGAGDPVATGLVASLARPGRNVTGISSITTETGQKSLELLVELAPGAKRIVYLADPANQVSAAVYIRIEEQARRLKVAIQMVDSSTREGLAQSLETVRREHVQALLIGSSTTVIEFGDEIAKFAAREKLPAVYGRLEYVRHGGLLVHGVDRSAVGTRGGELVDRILRGAKPAELPVQQLSAVRTVLNLKTARALGIKVPDSIRARADEVIE